ncbi:MAG: prepilin-type N-terminal cleavage/methylation domain-containing protein [Fimbriimonadales bacterium]
MRQKAFSLVELLVVIAVIAILAAILLPVFFRAKIQAKRTADITNMAAIARALSLYKSDQGGHPPLLVQAAEYNGNMLKRIEQVQRGFLFKRNIDDVTVLHSQGDPNEDQAATVEACWPTRDATASGPSQVQFKGPGDLVRYTDLAFNFNPGPLNGQNPGDPVEFYAYDSYDIGPSFNPQCASADGMELRYVLFWTQMGQGGGGPSDNPRQLGYRDQPEDTIITWNTYFQDETTAPLDNSKDTIVLYLSGTARPEDGRGIYERSWRYGQ